MPFIEVKVSVHLDDAKKTAVSEALTKIAGKALGKGESWVMTNIVGDQSMFFQGSSESCAYINVKLFGAASAAGASELTQKATQEMTKLLGIAANRVFVSYFATQQWGYSGQNF